MLTTGRSPKVGRGEILVRSLATGIDGTDEALPGSQLALPPRSRAMIAGHEAVGIAQSDSGRIRQGDLVCPLVRLPCGECRPCNLGYADFCTTGQYVEAGIKARHGFMRDEWTCPTTAVVRAPRRLGWKAVLAEPLSITVKGYETALKIQSRLPVAPRRRALVCGTGSLGGLAIMLLRLQGWSVDGFDRHDKSHKSSALLRQVGAGHRDSRDTTSLEESAYDLILETTASSKVLGTALPAMAPNGVAVLLGVANPAAAGTQDGQWTRRLVLANQVLAGSVNSNAGHFETSLRALVAIDAKWPDALESFLTWYKPEECEAAYEAHGPTIVKKAIRWDGS